MNISQEGTNPFKFGDKELDKMHGLNQYDFHARQYDAPTGRFTTRDPNAENYFSWSPYVYCGNNPMRLTDPDGKDWKDKVAGTFAGIATNIIPGSSSLRDQYAPNSRSDYNQALMNADVASVAVGASMIAGGGGISGGGVAVVVAGGTTASTGVGAPAGAGIATVGGVAITVGKASVIGGVYLMGNTASNASEGYDRGASSSAKSVGDNGSRGGKGSNHLKPNPDATGNYSSFRRGSDGKITNTTTYKQNPKNPSGFDEVKRVDKVGASHKNKSGQEIPTPHVHDKAIKDVRPARLDELPK